MSLPEVAIVTARCARSRAGYGIRMEKVAWNTWVLDWAFPLSEQVAVRERYEARQVDGQFANHPDFPGCPHCKAIGFTMCGHCGRITCWNTQSHINTCAWCGMTGELSGAVSSIRTSNDR